MDYHVFTQVVKEFLSNAETDVIIWILYFLPKSEGERVQMDHPLSHQIRWPCTNVTNHLLLLLNVPMTSTPLHSRGWLCSGVHNAEFFQILCPESTLAFDLGTIIKKKNIFMCKILLNLRRWKFLRSS